MPGKPRTIDEYLKPPTKENRTALEKLRKAIPAAVPEAKKCIRDDMPLVKLKSRSLAVVHRLESNDDL